MQTVTSVTREVEAFTDDMARAHVNLQWDKWLGNYCDPGEVCVANDGVLYATGDTYAAHFRSMVSTLAKVEHFEFLDRRVYELGPDTALVAMKYRQTVQFGANPSQEMRGAWTALVKRTAGSWRILHEHASHER